MNLEQDTAFWEQFDQSLENYLYAMKVVKEEMFGEYQWVALSGDSIEQIRLITNRLLDETSSKFGLGGK
jgi:hypothetical protein